MAISFSTALYYPYIEVRNEHWLRNAILFWDSIKTIVPASIEDPYTGRLARTLSDEGILQPVRVSSDMEEVESLTSDALEYLTDPASLALQEEPTERMHRDKLGTFERRLTDIHPEKLPYVIRRQLERTLNDGWLQVGRGFGTFYMTLLATKLSERLGLGLVTESSNADQLAVSVHKGKPKNPGWRRNYGGDYAAGGPRRSLPSSIGPGLLMDLVVQGIRVPDAVPLAKLIKFRTAHKAELAAFRKEVSKLTSDIPKNVSIEAMRQTVSDQYNNGVLPAVKGLVDSLRAQGWDAALNGFLKTSFFSAGPSSAAVMLGGIPGSLAIVAGAGISLTASAVSLYRERQKIKRDSPYAYLLSLDKRW